MGNSVEYQNYGEVVSIMQEMSKEFGKYMKSLTNIDNAIEESLKTERNSAAALSTKDIAALKTKWEELSDNFSRLNIFFNEEYNKVLGTVDNNVDMEETVVQTTVSVRNGTNQIYQIK